MSRQQTKAQRLDQVVVRLQAWAARQQAIDKQYNALRALVGCDLESPLLAALFDVWTAYTVAVSEIVGDKAEWLQWYELECDMGRRPKEVHSTGGRKIKVRTLRQLARVICD